MFIKCLINEEVPDLNVKKRRNSRIRRKCSKYNNEYIKLKQTFTVK